MSFLGPLFDWLGLGRKPATPKSTSMPRQVNRTAANMPNNGTPAVSGARPSVPMALPASGSPRRENERPGSPATPRGRGAATRITVGFDFGTHSTKVLFRKHGASDWRILRLGEPCRGYPTFGCPSLVRLVGGCLWFGGEALRSDEGILYRSLKARLLGPAHEGSLPTYPPGPDPHLLIVAYLVWAFRAVRENLRREFGPHELRMNLAAPMNHVQNERLREAYLHIVQAAWGLVFGHGGVEVGQGVALDSLKPHLAGGLDGRLVDESERHFEILPETIAPIVSMSFDPRLAPGIYLVMDMGGATTEISVNRVGKSEAGHHVHCYYDDVIHIGGDDFEASAGKGASDAEAGRRLDRVLKAVKRVWYRGYEKEKDGPRTTREQWKTLRVLLSGGGTRDPELASRIQALCPQRSIFLLDPCPYYVQRYEPANVESGRQSRVGAADLSLLGVAHGLAVEAQRWPEFLKPMELRPLERPHREDSPEAYWYVGGK